MGWNETVYTQYLIVGWQQPDPPYNWHGWNQLAPLLGPLMMSSRGPVGIRIMQESKTTEKELRFGKLSWNDASHQKWTHESSVTSKQSSDWRFLGAEFWNPNARRCESDDLPPDVFLKFWCDYAVPGGLPLTYDFSCHLVISAELLGNPSLRKAATDSVRFLANSRRAMICATREARWYHDDHESDRAAPSPMEYILSGMPVQQWVNKAPAIEDFPRGARWRAF